MLEPLTANDEAPFLNGDFDKFYETVNGQREDVPPMGALETGIAGVLIRYLWLFLGENPPGLVVAEMLFRLNNEPKVERRPDVAYVPYVRWPQKVITVGDAWQVVPELAVEVVSPTNTASKIQEKILNYFQYGVGLVWVIYPEQRMVHIYESAKTVRVLDGKDCLDGKPLFPDFRLELTRLFELAG